MRSCKLEPRTRFRVTVGNMQTTGNVEHLAEDDDPTRAAAPAEEVDEELSIPNPPSAPGPILTLSPEEITRFFLRARRDQDTERWDVRLDAALREILERANDFVPSESGGILLDDPRAKLAGIRTPRLTFIATFGPGTAHLLGKRIPSDRGFVGQIYRTGSAFRSDDLSPDDPLSIAMPARGAGRPVASVIGMPVIVGESICGVLQLINRRSGGPYSARDNELLRIFAAYMSSSIQNALDAIRARALARLDHLTGLFNSRYFHVRLEDEIAHADHNATDLSLLFIDLDHFKEVNNRYGHLAGSATTCDPQSAARPRRRTGRNPPQHPQKPPGLAPGPHVWVCPTNRVGPIFQFVFEEGVWKFDGPIGALRPRGKVVPFEEVP